MFTAESYDELSVRLEQCDQAIRRFSGTRSIQQDLERLLRTVQGERRQLSILAVECRRLRRTTSSYERQQIRLADYIAGLEKRIFWASLM